MLVGEGFCQGPKTGCLKMLCAHGAWSLDRLHDAGYLQNSLCMCDSQGSVHPMIWDCVCLNQLRDTMLGKPYFRREEQRPNWPVWTNCLIKDPTTFYPAPSLEPAIFWEIQGSDSLSQWALGTGLESMPIFPALCSDVAGLFL